MFGLIVAIFSEFVPVIEIALKLHHELEEHCEEVARAANDNDNLEELEKGVTLDNILNPGPILQ